MPFDPALRQIIAGFRNSPEWDEQLDLRLLRALWPRLVGPSLAARTEAVSIEGTRVIVKVPDRTWRRQLSPIRGRLLQRINEPWPHPWLTDIGFVHEDQFR